MIIVAWFVLSWFSTPIIKSCAVVVVGFVNWSYAAVLSFRQAPGSLAWLHVCVWVLASLASTQFLSLFCVCLDDGDSLLDYLRASFVLCVFYNEDSICESYA